MMWLDDVTPLSSKELDTVFRRVESSRILIVGDYCLDHYLFLDDSLAEQSVETGIMTRAVRSHRIEPGGAGNVAANLCALGARGVIALGVLGDDHYGRECLRQLETIGVDTTAMVVQPHDWSTSVYIKPYRDDQEEARIDCGNANELSDRTATELLDRFAERISDTDIVLINEQAMGSIHTPAVREGLSRILQSHAAIPVLIDSRRFGDSFSTALCKINFSEAAGLLDSPCVETEETVERAAELAGMLFTERKKPVFLTMGDHGAVAYDEQGAHFVPALHVTSRIDSVGAGDSIAAGLALALTAGLSPERSLFFAEHVAAVTITKLFRTGTATEEEVRHTAKNSGFRYAVEIAEDPRRAEMVEGTEIERINIRRSGQLKFALFDHDGTISTLREGWEAVMEPFMVKAILGGKYDTASPEIVQRIVHEVRAFIVRTTGIQTLIQMHGLVRMVQEFGFVHPNEVAEPLTYKQAYVVELERLVDRRVARLENGELDAEDFIIKGALEILKELRSRGVVIFLASGSDDDAVKREAARLGYESFFDGGIYGALDDLNHEPKRVVVDRILDQIGNEHSRQLIAFGDGPVEIMETRRRGGVCVGVASNEVRRYGLNPEKRQRLILAGAHAVVPDFSQFRTLLDILT